MAITAAEVPAQSDNFAEPIYLQPETSGGAGSAAAEEPTINDSVVVDLNDPNLLAMELDTSAEGDPYATPSPLPDARWRVKLKQRELNGPNGEKVLFTVKQRHEKGQPSYVKNLRGEEVPDYVLNASIEAKVQDPSGKFDGISLYDYQMNSRLDKRRGGVPILWLLQCLKVDRPKVMAFGALKELFQKSLASEPDCEVETHWVASPNQTDQERLEAAGIKTWDVEVKGMHNFPKDAKGAPLPEITKDTKIGPIQMRAQAKISRYFPAGAAKAAGMELGVKGK